MEKLNVLALANTLAIIDLILHPLFRLWVWLSPQSYEFMMKFFVAGWEIHTHAAFDLNPINIILSTLVEACVFWLLGAIVALLYNKLSDYTKT